MHLPFHSGYRPTDDAPACVGDFHGDRIIARDGMGLDRLERLGAIRRQRRDARAVPFVDRLDNETPHFARARHDAVKDLTGDRLEPLLCGPFQARAPFVRFFLVLERLELERLRSFARLVESANWSV